MTEEAELQAKIAAVAGKINQHKQQQPQTPTAQHTQPCHHAPYSTRGYSRWSPYDRGGRGGRGGYPQPHKNRTLVLGGGTTTPASEAESTDGTATPNSILASETFVSARGPGTKQLMSKDTYDREQRQKLGLRDRTRVARNQKVDREERAKLTQYATTQGNREMVVEGIRFQLRADGSKLIRVVDTKSTRGTPKKATIAGINFFRTKTGNLVRANAIKDLNRTIRQKQKPQCEHFTKHGTCPYGRTCNFAHDPEKVAICKTFLQKGFCPADSACDLSHHTDYSRVSACTHFLRGNCTNDACRYPHIHVSPTAAVCRPFALLGFCEKGSDCPKRHVFECPDYANNGKCENKKCALPHPDRASVLRKAAAKQSKIGSEENSDMSSDEEDQDDDNDIGFEDIDSDEAEDVIMGDADNNHELSQQQDFVPLS